MGRTPPDDIPRERLAPRLIELAELSESTELLLSRKESDGEDADPAAVVSAATIEATGPVAAEAAAAAATEEAGAGKPDIRRVVLGVDTGMSRGGSEGGGPMGGTAIAAAATAAANEFTRPSSDPAVLPLPSLESSRVKPPRSFDLGLAATRGLPTALGLLGLGRFPDLCRVTRPASTSGNRSDEDLFVATWRKVAILDGRIYIRCTWVVNCYESEGLGRLAGVAGRR